MVGSGATALPNVPVNVIKLDPGDPSGGTVYVGTEVGLYRSTDGGASWARFGTGLPLVSVTDLAISADGSSIRAATFGRGFWEIYPKPGGSPSGNRPPWKRRPSGSNAMMCRSASGTCRPKPRS